MAKLSPAEKQRDQTSIDEAVRRLKDLRKGSTLGGLSWKELRDEGRK